MSHFLKPEPGRIAAGLRTVAASLVALGLAYALHLDRPYWAAMTVWLVAQPTRGLQLERGLFRLLGTVVGSVAGIAMLHLAPNDAWLIVFMALWLALCAGVGNLLRHLRGYAGLLAGYSGVIVALIAFETAGDPAALAWDRLACNIIGVVVSLALTGLFTPRAPRAAQLETARQLAADAVTWAARVLREGADAQTVALERRLMSEMGSAEGAVDAAASGSPRGYRQAKQLRALFTALLRLMYSARAARGRINRGDLDPAGWRDRLADDLAAAAEALRQPGAPLPDLAAITAGIGVHRPRLADAAAEVSEALAVLQAEGSAAPPPRLVLHRDWPEAWQAAVRSGVLVAGIGGVWLLTRWPGALGVMLGAAIFSVAFSRFDNPARQLQPALIGAALGALAALGFRLLAGEIGQEWQVLIAIAPILAVGAVAGSDARFTLGSLDFCMIFLMVSAPAAPLHGLPPEAPHQAAGVVLGMIAALLAFRLLLPINPASRLASVSRQVVQDLERLAAEPGPPDAKRWRARSLHRALRLAMRASTGAQPDVTALDAALAGLAAGSAILDLRARPIESAAALARLSHLSDDPKGTAEHLQLLARTAADAELAAEMRDIAGALLAAPDFFALKGSA